MNSMGSLDSVSLDIVEVYRRYCDIRSGNLCFQGDEDCRDSDECRMVKCSREELAQLTKLVELSLCAAGSRTSLFDEIRKLMSRFDFMVDFSEFSRLYEFVYFICRENGQKNITVKNAVSAWRLVLFGRFRLLNQWCDFVEKNQRHNISEDTWRQVLAFSRCVHENLEGYDPAGAWPVLIDDFVEHMYSVSGPNKIPSDSEVQLWTCDDPLPGLKSLPGLKRKPFEDMESDDVGSLISTFPGSTDLGPFSFNKRYRSLPYQPATNKLMEITRHSNNNSNITVQSNAGSSKSKCAVEGCLSQGFAGLLPTGSCLQFKKERLAQFVRNYKQPSSEKILPRVI